MRRAAPGEQEWSPVYLCPMAQHRVWHATGAQLMFVDWMDGCVRKCQTYHILSILNKTC